MPWCPQRLDRSIRLPGSGVTNDSRPSYGFWELNLSSLEEQPVLTAESSLLPQRYSTRDFGEHNAIIAAEPQDQL